MEYNVPTAKQLVEKWADVLDAKDVSPINESHRRLVTAVLLENQEKENSNRALNEAGSVAANVANFDPVLIGMVRRAAPQMIAYDVCGVQPMTAPNGLVFAMTSRYGNAAGQEALFNEANASYAGAYTATPGDATQLGSSPVATDDNGLDPWASNAPGNFTTGAGMTTAVAEAVVPAEMSFKIEKSTVTAESVKLKSEFTEELRTDMKNVHGLDAEAELSNILTSELTAEINRRVIRSIYTVAQTGAATATTPGTFDLDVDANGRWSVERFKGMIFQIDKEANRIGQLTRRGRGNFLMVSADVASALAMSGKLDYAPAMSTDLNVDDASTTFAGVLMGKYKVYIDPYMANGTSDQFCLVGYRGKSPFDAGMFYCPYVQLQMYRAINPTNGQPVIGFGSRYGLIQHPLNSADNANTNPAVMKPRSNRYFRMFRVSNLG